jgi:hypothetical protein
MDSAFGFELEEIARLTQQPLLPAIACQLLKQVRSRADSAATDLKLFSNLFLIGLAKNSASSELSSTFHPNHPNRGN